MDNTSKMNSTHKTIVGKKLIDILMFSMYPDAKIIYREYIQNACDAIKDAVEIGVLSEIKDGHICVRIDERSKCIQIADNGIGIAMNEVESLLLNIADSRKDGFNSAGQYGIGRLVGAGYCKKLSFKTSYAGENKVTEIALDVVMARQILDNKNDHRSAPDVIDSIATTTIRDEDANKHYFIATLEEVRPEYPELLNEDIIIEYLKEVAPIDYSMPFKNRLIQKSAVGEYEQLQATIPHYRISVNDEADIRKRYGLRIEGTGDDIDSLEYFKLEDDTYGLLAWGWYAVTPYTKAIPATDKNRGIRLRKLNIQIGSCDVLNQYYKEPRGNNYFYGEIHAINAHLRPESSRSGLTPTPEAICLQGKLRDYFSLLVQLYHIANETKNAIKGIAIISDQFQQSQRQEIDQETHNLLNAAKAKLEKIKKSKNAQNGVAGKVVGLYENMVDNSTKLGSNDENAISFTATKPVEDIFDLLKDKYSNEQIEFIQQIFKALDKHCPPKYKKMIQELGVQVIKDLSK